MVKIKWPEVKKAAPITSVVEAHVQENRDRLLSGRAEDAVGKRGQPPMTDRLQAVMIYVEYLESGGVKFATARKSRMNKCVQQWLNERARCTPDSRKSRRRVISADAVEDILKEVAAQRKAAKQ